MLNKDTLIYTVAKFLPSLAGFVTLTICSYYLSPEEVGRYNVIYSSTLLVNSLLFQWLRVTLARFYYKYEGVNQEPFVNTIVLFCVLTLIISLFITATFIIIQPSETSFYLLAFVWLSVFSLYDINLELHRTSLNSKIYLKVEFIKSVIHIILSTVLIVLFKNFYVIILAYILSQTIPLAFYKHAKMKLDFNILNKSNLLSMLKFGFPLAIMLSSSFINNSIDRVLIASYLNIEQAGLYSIGYDMFRQAIWIPFIILNLANFPILIKLYEESKFNILQEKLKENIDILVVISIIIGTLIFINSNAIVGIFIGEKFRNAAKLIMPYIVVSTVLYGLSIFHLNYSFQFKSKTIKLACIYLIGSTLKIIINVLFLEKYGIILAAQTTLITYLVIFSLSAFYGKYEYRLPKPNYLNIMYLIIVSACIVKIEEFVVVDSLYISLLLKSVIALTIYAILLYKLNVLGVNFFLEKLQLKIK